MSWKPSADATCISISRDSPVASYNTCPVPSGWNRPATAGCDSAREGLDGVAEMIGAGDTHSKFCRRRPHRTRPRRFDFTELAQN
jgi:hypothetical protein